MPATITHAYFGYDIYNNLPTNIKNKVDLDRIKMFSQSSDPVMFYYNINIKHSKKIRNLQKKFHTTKTRDFFINLIEYIKENKLYNDKDVCSYLIGLICHYCLDSTTHPYIFYKTGNFNKKKPTTYKYNNRHAFMEAYIDNYMILNREKINPYHFNISKYCFDTKPFSNNLNKCIDYSFYKTYHIKNMSNIYYKSIKSMKLCLNLFRRDKYGIKKFFYKIIDTFTPRYIFRFEAISYHYPLKDKRDFLNTKHELWRNPIEYNLTSNESFIELYLKALKEANNIIIDTFKFFDNKDVNLNKIFTNKSYVTGLDCNIKKELKYFEF
ncbi:MAG: zinc dependent phospholipase C family protein [Bacilli bacterium]|nr:zinc dependent phospholipase C family protein [Bacilli bacterium]